MSVAARRTAATPKPKVAKVRTLDERRRAANRRAMKLLVELVDAWPGARDAIELAAATRHLERSVSATRGNPFSATTCAIRSLLGAWPEHARGLAYRKAMEWIRESCRSCGDPAVRNNCCTECWREFVKGPRPPSGAA